VVLTDGKARRMPPVLHPPARPLACVAKKKRQPASDDFDISQDPLPKFNLGLQLANITRCRGRYHTAAHRILKATKRGINKIHLGAPRKNRTQWENQGTPFSLEQCTISSFPDLPRHLFKKN
jgi:hypothetical protein